MLDSITSPSRQGSGFAPANSGQAAHPKNISETERLLSLAGGATLVVNGLVGPRPLRLLSVLSGAGLLYRGWTQHCVAYSALGINTARSRGGATAVPARAGVKIERSVAVQRPAHELVQHWKNLDNLPRVMSHLESVKPTGDGKSHWVAVGPFGKRVEWDAEIHEEGDNFIAWRSLPGGDIDTAGSVHFRPLGENRGTAIEVSLKYNPPGGKATAKILDLLGQGLDGKLEEDLHRFKSQMEAGEAPTVEGQTHGSRD